MNYLAHLFLSHHSEALLVGNFIADFVTNRQVSTLPVSVQKGIALHRKIDSFTDRHPVVLRGVRRLYPFHGKYASVIIDVFYDYLLSVNWSRYHEQPLAQFASRTYELLESNLPIMPPLLKKRLPLMIADDWLSHYGTLEGLSFAIERMKSRASKPEMLDKAVESLQRDYVELEAEFHLFFPEVWKYVMGED